MKMALANALGSRSLESWHGLNEDSERELPFDQHGQEEETAPRSRRIGRSLDVLGWFWIVSARLTCSHPRRGARKR